MDVQVRARARRRGLGMAAAWLRPATCTRRRPASRRAGCAGGRPPPTPWVARRSAVEPSTAEDLEAPPPARPARLACHWSRAPHVMPFPAVFGSPSRRQSALTVHHEGGLRQSRPKSRGPRPAPRLAPRPAPLPPRLATGSDWLEGSRQTRSVRHCRTGLPAVAICDSCAAMALAQRGPGRIDALDGHELGSGGVLDSRTTVQSVHGLTSPRGEPQGRTKSPARVKTSLSVGVAGGGGGRFSQS